MTILFTQFCESNALVNEINEELTEGVIKIRTELLQQIRVIDYLLKSHAATDFSIGQLLKGKGYDKIYFE